MILDCKVSEIEAVDENFKSLCLCVHVGCADVDACFGMFKDVRLCTILKFVNFWAPLFSRCFCAVGHFRAPLASDLPQCQEL